MTDSDEASSEVAVSSEVSVSLEGSSALEEPPKIIELPNRLPAIDDLFDDALPVAELSAQEQTDIRMGIATAMQRMRKNTEFFKKSRSFLLHYYIISKYCLSTYRNRGYQVIDSRVLR